MNSRRTSSALGRFTILALVLATGLSCDLNPTRPPDAGGITISLVTPPEAAVAVSSVRIRVTGPTTRTVTTSMPTSAQVELSIDDLAPGTYALVVEGLADEQIARIGAIEDVSVAAGRTTAVQVSFASFQPVIVDAEITDTLDVLHFNLAFSAVPSATSYIVAWSLSSDLADAQTKTITGTSTDITVEADGKYYVTVRAVSPLTESAGVSSAPKTVYLYQGVESVTISAPATTLAAGETVQLTAEARDGEDAVVSNVAWVWQSSNHNVAIVDHTGLVTGIGPGDAEIVATGKGTPGTVDLTVTVAATQLAFTVQPASATAGEALSPAIQVEIRDASGARVRSSRVPVTLAITTNPGSGTLSGSSTVTATDGIATFSGISIDKAGTGYQLAAAVTGLPDVASTAFDVAPAVPAKLAFATQPANTPVGNIMAAIEVEILDAFGNRVTSAAHQIGLAFFTSPSGATLGGTATQTAAGGTASFADLELNESGSNYRLIAVAEGLSSAISTVFSGQLRAYVASVIDNTVRVIETSDNSVVTDIPVGTTPLLIAISPDGNRAYVTNFGAATVSAIDLSTNAVLTNIPVGVGPQGIAISPDGSLVYVANYSAGTVSVINAATNVPGLPITVGTSPVGIAFTADGSRAFVVNEGTSNISVIDVAGHVVSTTIASGGTSPRNIAISPDGAVAYVTNSGTDNVTVIRVSNNTVLTTFPVGDNPVGVVFSPDGRFAYIVHSASRNVAVVANGGLSATHTVVDWIAVGTAPRKIAMTPGGSYLYVANGNDNNLSVISTDTRSVIETIATGRAPRGVTMRRVP